jgi:DNA-binding response OmpR family regulator
MKTEQTEARQMTYHLTEREAAIAFLLAEHHLNEDNKRGFLSRELYTSFPQTNSLDREIDALREEFQQKE